MNSAFPQSPLFVVESALDDYLEAAIETDDFLRVIEQQYQRACDWMENLRTLAAAKFEDVTEMQTLGFDGNSIMVEALEELHHAVREDHEVGLEAATELLYDGHEMVERSFQLCEKIEAETDEFFLSTISDRLG